MKFGFGGHESFPLRYGWLKKGYDLVAGNPGGLTGDSAIIALGVGKNMVGSIRHWGLACGVFEEGAGGRGVQSSALGDRLLGASGWDPYLEDTGSTWFLHWQLVNNPNRAGVWHSLFFRPRGNRFTKEAVVSEITEQLSRLGQRHSSSTIERDVDVLVRSYCRRQQTAGKSSEELLESPFTTLGLLREGGTAGEFELVQGVHPSLPVAVFEYALLDFAARSTPARRALSLDDLMYAENSPGRVFRLSEEGLMSRLHALQKHNSATYVVDETAGLRQLLIRGEMPDRITVLESYFRPATAASRAA